MLQAVLRLHQKGVPWCSQTPGPWAPWIPTVLILPLGHQSTPSLMSCHLNYSLSSQITCKFSQGKSYVLLSLFISGVKNHSLNTPEMTEINPAAVYRPALPNPLPEISICLTRKEHSLVEPSVTLERAQSHFWSLRTQRQFTSLQLLICR